MKFIFLFFFSCTVFINANAQAIRAGASFGVDASRMAVNDASGTPLTYINNPAGGIFIEAAVSKALAIQAEANYSAQGLAGIGVSSTLSFKFNYITIPLMLKFYGTANFSLLAGVQLGMLQDAKAITNEITEDYKSIIKSKDHYTVLGAEYRFDNGAFAGARYHTGLSDINTDPTLRMHNRYFSFRVGYSFSVKK